MTFKAIWNTFMASRAIWNLFITNRAPYHLPMSYQSFFLFPKRNHTNYWCIWTRNAIIGFDDYQKIWLIWFIFGINTKLNRIVKPVFPWDSEWSVNYKPSYFKNFFFFFISVEIDHNIMSQLIHNLFSGCIACALLGLHILFLIQKCPSPRLVANHS